MVELTKVELEKEDVTSNVCEEDSGEGETSEEEEHPNEEGDESLTADKDVEMDCVDNVKTNTNEEKGFQSSNKDLLAYFWKLVDLNENVRCDAVVGLVTELDKTNSKDEISYSLKRLVKGLSSSRKAARQGFATALTHVLNKFSTIDTQEVLDLMSEHLAVQGSFKGSEESDAYFGQVFGYMAICRSRIKLGLDKDVELVKKLTQSFVTLMKKKSYLGEVCATAICESILRNISYDTFQSIEPILNEQLTKGWKGCAPEDLMIALTVQLVFKDQLPMDHFKTQWKESNLFHESNFKDLCTVLMDTTNTSHPRVHSLWNLVFDYLFSSDILSNDILEKFWKTIIEEGLLQSTHERKYLAMNLLLKIAPKIPSNKVDVVFSESIIRCIINNCQSKMNYLYKSVKSMLHELPEKLAENEDEEVLVHVIKCLVGPRGHVAFDSITKSRTVEELASKLSGDLTSYFEWLKRVFINGTTDLQSKNKEAEEKDVKECHCFVADQLVLLLKRSKIQNDEALVTSISCFLFYHAYFVSLKKIKGEAFMKKVPKHPVSDATHQVYRQRFNTALVELANFHVKNDQEEKNVMGGIARDGELFTWKIICFAKKLLEMPECTHLVAVWTPEVYDCWNASLSRIEALMTEAKNRDGATSMTDGTPLLFSHTTLQLFSLREEAVDTMNELTMCFDKAKEKTKKKKSEPHWTEVLSDILLGFMAQSSHLMRQIVDVVYPTIAPHVTEEAFNLLIDSLKPMKKGEAGGAEFENESESDMEEDMTVADVNGDKENKEAAGGTDDKENKEEAGGEKDKQAKEEDSESEDDSEDDTDDEMEIDEAFKTELKAALGKAAMNEEESSDDGNEDEEEDIDMDTCTAEELNAMDQALANVFKSLKQKQMEKKKQKDKKLSVVHFKLRVLDLIEIFIKKHPTDKKILLLLEPLYDVISASNMKSDEQPLFERTVGLVKNKLCNLHEYPSSKDFDIEGVHSQIERLVELAKSASSALMVDYITQGVIYLIRVLRGNEDIKKPSPRRTRSKKEKKQPVEAVKLNSVGCLNEERLLTCYRTALTEFMTKKSSHLQPVFFNQLIQRFPNIGWKLATDLPQYMNNGCNNFRKLKAVEMLKLLLSNKGDHFEKFLGDLHKEMSDNIIKAFQATKTEGYTLKARQFKDIVQLVDLFVKCVSKYSDIDCNLDKPGLKTSLMEALESPVISRSSPLQLQCQKIVDLLDGKVKADRKSVV